MTFTKKAELHCHSNDLGIRNIYAPMLTDSVQTTEDIIKRCLKLNIKILSVTDHDSLYGYRQADKYIKENNLDILLIPGCEITSKEGHILAYNIYQEIPAKLSAKETIDRIHQQGGIAVVAHPFMIRSTGNKLFDLKPDAIEGLNAAIPMIANHKAIAAANKMGVPYTASSDAHENQAIGNGCTLFPQNTNTIEDFVSNLKTGNFSIKFQHSSYLTMLTEHLKSAFIDTFTGKIFQPIPAEAQVILDEERD